MVATEKINSWFYSNVTKEEFAKKMAEENKSVFIDLDGTARCRYCKAPRMFLLEGDYGGKCHKWLPIACKCKDDNRKNSKLQEYDGELPF